LMYLPRSVGSLGLAKAVCDAREGDDW